MHKRTVYEYTYEQRHELVSLLLSRGSAMPIGKFIQLITSFSPTEGYSAPRHFHDPRNHVVNDQAPEVHTQHFHEDVLMAPPKPQSQLPEDPITPWIADMVADVA
jgi:hypothetical protein